MFTCFNRYFKIVKAFKFGNREHFSISKISMAFFFYEKKKELVLLKYVFAFSVFTLVSLSGSFSSRDIKISIIAFCC